MRWNQSTRHAMVAVAGRRRPPRVVKASDKLGILVMGGSSLTAVVARAMVGALIEGCLKVHSSFYLPTARWSQAVSVIGRKTTLHVLYGESEFRKITMHHVSPRTVGSGVSIGLWGGRRECFKGVVDVRLTNFCCNQDTLS